jgi:hypothetical protein
MSMDIQDQVIFFVRGKSFQVSGDIDAAKKELEAWNFKNDSEKKECLEIFEAEIVKIANEMLQIKRISAKHTKRKSAKPRNIMRHLTPPKKKRK